MAEQLCVLCEKLFEVDDSFTVIRPMMRGKMLVLDKNGAAHELLSEKRTEQRQRSVIKKEQTYIIREVEKVLAESPVATPAVIEKVVPEPEPPSVIKKSYQLFGTVRAELNHAGFTTIDGDDGLEYLLRGDGIIPDVSGLRAISAGERVVFTPNQRFRKNIAQELMPVSRANEPSFEPDFKDWYNFQVKHVDENGFLTGHLVGMDVEVFVASRVLHRQSSYTHMKLTDIRIGDVLAVRIKPSVAVANKWEAIVAIYEDLPQEAEENSHATLGDLYAQPGD
jgi:hypothetical protein